MNHSACKRGASLLGLNNNGPRPIIATGKCPVQLNLTKTETGEVSVNDISPLAIAMRLHSHELFIVKLPDGEAR